MNRSDRFGSLSVRYRHTPSDQIRTVFHLKVDEATLRRTVSKNIAAYRKAHSDTQLTLAEKLNYSDKSVSKWERGESLPDIYIQTIK